MNKNPKKKLNKHVLKRVVKTLFEFYPLLLPITVFCILFAAGAAAIPDVMVLEIPAISRAKAKIVPALLPRSGVRSC